MKFKNVCMFLLVSALVGGCLFRGPAKAVEIQQGEAVYLRDLEHEILEAPIAEYSGTSIESRAFNALNITVQVNERGYYTFFK